MSYRANRFADSRVCRFANSLAIALDALRYFMVNQF